MQYICVFSFLYSLTQAAKAWMGLSVQSVVFGKLADRANPSSSERGEE